MHALKTKEKKLKNSRTALRNKGTFDHDISTPQRLTFLLS